MTAAEDALKEPLCTLAHRDPFHGVTVVLSGEELAIEFPDGTVAGRFPVHAGQVDWDEPFERVHRGTNVGTEPYEEVAIFFLDSPDSVPQPRAEGVGL